MKHFIPANHQSRDKFKIFVAGAPAQMEASQLTAYFTSFGVSAKVKPFKSHSVKGKQSGKGCFILEVFDRNTHSAILEHDHYLVCGRRLLCQPYLRGNMLAAENEDKNMRRVILKFVPRSLSETDLKTLIENTYGKIDCLFAYRPESKILSVGYNSKKFRTYSVMFNRIESAEKIISQGLHFFKHWPAIEVQKFKRKEGALKNASPIKNGFQKPLLKPNHPERILRKFKSMSHLRSNHYFEENTQQKFLTNQRSNSMGKYANQDLDNTKLCDLLLYINQANHYKRPGSKGYLWTHKYINDFIARFSRCDSQDSFSDYRVNLAR